METKKIIKIASVAISVSAVIVSLGFGCGVGFQPVGSDESIGQSSVSPAAGSGDNGALSIVSNTKTVAVTNYSSVLSSMVSMTGVPASNNTKTIFAQNIDNFSEIGGALSVNAPMLMAYMTVGAEVCNDLVTAETALAAANRRFFVNFNLATNSNNISTVTDANISDLVRRLSRQFWQRNEDSAELTMINAGIKEMVAAQAATTAGLSRRAVIYACTAMISTTSAYQL